MASGLFTRPFSNVTSNAMFDQFIQQGRYDDYTVLFLALIGLGSYLTSGLLWNKPDPNHYIWYERPQQSALQDSGCTETRNIAQKLEETRKSVVIFWGSQSGTAEGFAHRLARECHQRFRLEALVADLSDYDVHSISLIPASKIVVFLVSTYGEGDPSDNATELWDWLKSTSLTLSNIRYAAFGLGNTNYKYYNKVVDVLVQKLNISQAIQLLPPGRADDANNGTEEDFLAWKERLLRVLQLDLGLEEYEQQYEPALRIVEDPSLDTMDCYLGEPVQATTASKTTAPHSAITALTVEEARCLTPLSAKDRKCVCVALDIGGHTRLKYKTGDHLAVYPVNPAREVTRLLTVLDLKSRMDIPLLITSLDPANKKLRMPNPTTLTALFTSYLEICAPVPRETTRSLIAFAPTERIASYLSKLTSDKDTYSSFLSTTHVTLGRLLEHTLSLEDDSTEQQMKKTWAGLPLSLVLEVLRPMTPRYYSISSSAVMSPQQLSITVVHSPTPLSSRPDVSVPGLASSYLVDTFLTAGTYWTEPQREQQQRPPQPKLYASIVRSTFKLPLSSTTPIILVGTGTGIAPFRAFLHERATLASMGREVGHVLLFYGCRNEADYLYREEIETLAGSSSSSCSSSSSSIISKRRTLKGKLQILVAFSRPEHHNTASATPSSSSSSSSSDSSLSLTKIQSKSNSSPKTYVQDLIQTPPNASQISSLMLAHDAAIYFCGSTRMARDAGDAVMRAVSDCQTPSWNMERRLEWRDERRRVGKWREDVWG